PSTTSRRTCVRRTAASIGPTTATLTWSCACAGLYHLTLLPPYHLPKFAREAGDTGDRQRTPRSVRGYRLVVPTSGPTRSPCRPFAAGRAHDSGSVCLRCRRPTTSLRGVPVPAGALPCMTHDSDDTARRVLASLAVFRGIPWGWCRRGAVAGAAVITAV